LIGAALKSEDQICADHFFLIRLSISFKKFNPCAPKKISGTEMAHYDKFEINFGCSSVGRKNSEICRRVSQKFGILAMQEMRANTARDVGVDFLRHDLAPYACWYA
jgi:hypothetical protein